MNMEGAWAPTVGSENAYQYNGKELNGGFGLDWNDYGARWYDASVARWWSVDPLADSYNSVSPYTYVLNNPLKYIDPDGMRVSIVGNDEYKTQVFNALINLALSSNTGAELVNEAFGSEKTLVIGNTREDIDNQIDEWNSEERGYSTLAFNLDQATQDLDASNGSNGKVLSQTLETGLAHEIGHFLSPQTGRLLNEKGQSTQIAAEEVYAVEMENRVRKEMGLDERTHYSGLNVYGKEIVQSKYEGYYSMRNKKGYAQTNSGTKLNTPLKRKVNPLEKDYKFTPTKVLRKALQKPMPKTIWTISN